MLKGVVQQFSLSHEKSRGWWAFVNQELASVLPCDLGNIFSLLKLNTSYVRRIDLQRILPWDAGYHNIIGKVSLQHDVTG